jgi:hypothetical protein
MNEQIRAKQFQQWLDKITQHLIEPARTQTYQELGNHYMDACAYYQSRGNSADEAHMLAMASMGDAGEIAMELQQVHFSSRRALWVLAACLAYPVSLYVLQSLYSVLSHEVITVLASIITSIIIIFVVLSVKQLLQPSEGDMHKPIYLMIVSQVLWAIFPLLGVMFYGKLPLMNEYGAGYFDFNTVGFGILSLGMFLSELVSGISTFWLGGKLLKYKQKLIYANGIGLTMIGLLTIILCAMVLLNNQMMAYIISSLNYVLVTIVLSLFAYFFFSIFKRGYNPPLQSVR